MSAVGRKPDYSTYPSLDFTARRDAARQLIEMRGRGAAVPDAQMACITRFYSLEARLLDEERYAEWYELLADDLFYWAPLRSNRFRREKAHEIDPNAMALFDESKADMAVRLGRLSSNLVWTEDPPTRHVYIVSNVEAFETSKVDEYEVHSTFMQYRNRAEHDQAALVGRRRDLLRQIGEGFQIARRLILLPYAVLLAKNLSVFF